MKIFTLLLALALYGLSPSKSEVIGEFESFDIEIPYDWNIYSEDFQMEIGPTSKFSEEQCLAEAIYFEAGNQPYIGKLAVGNVIINRMVHMDYPQSICEVVHQGPVRESWKDDGTTYPIRHRCQFSYWCDGRSDTPRPGVTWDESIMIAEWILSKVYDHQVIMLDPVEGATHYHATYVSPTWAKNMQKVVQIQEHVFYK